MMRDRRPLLVLSALAMAGCARHRPAVPVAIEAPPAVAAAAAPLPAGASPGMLVPQPLADGSFATPNRALSEAGAVWHLRTGLNVAALSCPGEEGAAIRAGYNGWLKRQKAPLAKVATAYAAEYRVATPAGRFAYDGAMTRLYNFWAQTPARPALCAAAAEMIGEVAAADAAGLRALASARLATLDAAVVDFYRAYDAWRRGAAATPSMVIAAAAPAPALPAPVLPAAAAAGTRPRLVLDLDDLPIDTTVVAQR